MTTPLTMEARLNRRLFRRFLVLGVNVAVIVLGGIFYWEIVRGWHHKIAAEVKEANDLDLEIQKLHATKQQMDVTLANARKVMGVSSPSALTIANAKDTLVTNSKKFHIKNLKVRRMDWRVLSLQENNVLNTKLLINFDAFTDVDAMTFISSLLDQCPGYLDITSLALKREGDEVQRSPSIKTTVEIQWYAIHDVLA
jgi:hypothetical protein